MSNPNLVLISRRPIILSKASGVASAVVVSASIGLDLLGPSSSLHRRLERSRREVQCTALNDVIAVTTERLAALRPRRVAA